MTPRTPAIGGFVAQLWHCMQLDPTIVRCAIDAGNDMQSSFALSAVHDDILSRLGNDSFCSKCSKHSGIDNSLLGEMVLLISCCESVHFHFPSHDSPNLCLECKTYIAALWKILESIADNSTSGFSTTLQSIPIGTLKASLANELDLADVDMHMFEVDDGAFQQHVETLASCVRAYFTSMLPADPDAEVTDDKQGLHLGSLPHNGVIVGGAADSRQHALETPRKLTSAEMCRESDGFSESSSDSSSSGSARRAMVKPGAYI
ncbi:hypothetical protein THAOC_23408 [Thalassiosira oceanica]|uniref:Uncharacterized protein n=1 Tax=Thalassiosira oceanica TaxID=159749 RepID=K0SDG9_THAOC|nr:hypothetical protein THAOC_23408 [Thalassiosira oceanica]|eukprot:EJK56662.1 hypothetical protein THAOC_23408 [Thalassiosira oceanica]